MPYGQRSTSKQKSVRLSGFFGTRRRGLFIGGLKYEQFNEGFLATIKEAYQAKRGLTFFLWSNDDDGPKYVLSMGVERDKEEREDARGNERVPRRRIEADDNPFEEKSERVVSRKIVDTDDDLPF